MIDVDKLMKCETHAQVKELLRDCPIMASGCFRDVYALDDAVVKVGQDDYGVLHNEWEIWLSGTLPKDAPIARVLAHASSSVWLIMERVSETYYERTGRMTPDCEVVLDIGAYGIGDLHGKNLGYINGRLVAIDYGQ